MATEEASSLLRCGDGKNSRQVRLSVRKRLLFVAVAGAFALIMIEVGLRCYFASRVGADVLLYGTPWHRKTITSDWTSLPSRSAVVNADIQRPRRDVRVYQASMTHEEWKASRSVVEHTNALSGYSKYFPGQDRVDFDVDTGEQFAVGINSHGFRGPEFKQEKTSGVIRVVTLGASSTFGYFDRDDETYPHYLQMMLNDNPAGQRYEVINLGIPHMNSANIRALFLAEAIALEPDVVTFYEGNNDTSAIYTLTQSNFRRVLSAVGRRSILLALIDSAAGERINKVVSSDDFDQRAAEISKAFVMNVSAIKAECDERKIHFIVATQQNNSQTIARPELANIAYADEAEFVRNRMESLSPMRSRELAFLTHSVLMKNLRDWTRKEGVTMLDGIQLLDSHRDEMLSWVHLSPAANRILAAGMVEAIRDTLSVGGRGRIHL